ncbi:MAG: hypothetical protein K0R70_233 [Steroidobacteraceae bacterium]|jgi:hypothetical protein|nr:hypothetical protein [Steroidobacteraceae bacterium]
MSLRTRLQRWWDKLLGRPPWYRDSNVTVSRTDLYTEGASRKPTRPESGELSLQDDEPAAKARGRGSAGVNPYSNDAGFTKPRAWDRIDHD